jgi:hypothetical protein
MNTKTRCQEITERIEQWKEYIAACEAAIDVLAMTPVHPKRWGYPIGHLHTNQLEMIREVAAWRAELAELEKRG